MKHLLGLLLLLLSCRPNVAHSEVSVDFFLDKWWELGDNPLINDGTCFLLVSETNEIWVRYPEITPLYNLEGYWSLKEDHILLEDIYGYNISVWLYGACDDYNIFASSGLMAQESKLYNCEF